MTAPAVELFCEKVVLWPLSYRTVRMCVFHAVGHRKLIGLRLASSKLVGYVMSGSRYHRMNTVRMHRENQVISV